MNLYVIRWENGSEYRHGNREIVAVEIIRAFDNGERFRVLMPNGRTLNRRQAYGYAKRIYHESQG